jgi:hypothetical protein
MLNLSARQYNSDGIFTQSMADMTLRKNRMLASTGFANLNNSMHTTRLPQLSRSFSSSKSTKLKLTTIEATLSSISQQLQELRLETRVCLTLFKESRRYGNFLKEDLGVNTLGSLRFDLQTVISKFDKTFKLSKKNDEDRSHALNLDCHKLRESSTNLKSIVSTL